MSIYSPLSKYPDSAETAVAPGAVIQAEGLALTRIPGALADGVAPSTGASGEVFCGFSSAQTSAVPFLESMTNKVEEFTVPATGAVTLQFTPVAGQVFVFDVTGNAAVASPTVTGKQVTGLTPGDDVRVTYKYTLSVTQAVALHGNVQPGGYSGSYINQIGLIKRGLIYTSEFDSSKNWAAATSIKLAAGGQITDQTGSGVTINGYVVSLPTQDTPFLGIEFSAA